MCGLAGSFRRDGDGEDLWVDGALTTIAHRGPDARGIVTWTAATHGHVRLAVLDLEERSNQPFVYGGVLLSYNGECWNYRSLRRLLEATGRKFRTEGDTEVMAALIDWKLSEGQSVADAMVMVDGQFALAVTESVSGRTWLARDRLGEVPLYVLEPCEPSLFVREDWQIRWASERKVFGARAAEAWALPAGTVMALPDGPPKPFWSLPLRLTNSPVRPAELLEYLMMAVERRLQSDVPVAFLSSGGLDSSLIMRLTQATGADVIAYTAEMGGPNPDSSAAAMICSDLGVELRVVQVPHPSEAPWWIDATIGTIEIAMKAQVEIGWPCLFLANQIREDGFRVVLSGEGADELFGGYGNLARKATGDAEWMSARRASVEKMARGNCVRTNKSFMKYGVEARLPFLDYRLVEAVLPCSRQACPPGKGLLKEAARILGLPAWVIDQPKRTFQGAVGTLAAADELFDGGQVKAYNDMARELFGGLPRD